MFSSIKSRFILIFTFFIFIPLIITGVALSLILTKEIESKIITTKSLILESLYKDVIYKHIENMEATTLALSRNQDLYKIFTDEHIKDHILESWELSIDIFSDNITIHYGTSENEIITSNPWKAPESYNTRIRPWYINGKNKNYINWSPPYIEHTTNELTLSSTIGITNNNGDFTGVLSVNTSITQFLKNLQDKSQNINNEIIMVFNYILPFSINDAIGNDGLSFNWGEIILQKQKFLQINGIEYYYQSIGIPRLKAHLFILIDKDEIDKELIDYLQIIIPILLVGLILTIVAAFLLSKSIINKITQARLYLSELSNGNYNHREKFSEKGEFGILNSSITTLATTISSKITELNSLNKELNESLKKTNRLVKLRTSLIHLLSHNSASPITCLYNVTFSLVQDDKTNKEYRMLHTASRSLKSLSENIMTYLKLDEGLESASSEEFDLLALTEILLNNYCFRCDEKRISVTLNSDKSTKVYSNYFMVKMILENLIDNAVKYSFKDSSITINIGTIDNCVAWDILDGGPGFTPEDRQHLFGKFKKLSSKPTDGEGSVGLGLYIVKQISNSIGISVTLEDTPPNSSAMFRLKFN
jgi:signal transduction histidine kinase